MLIHLKGNLALVLAVTPPSPGRAIRVDCVLCKDSSGGISITSVSMLCICMFRWCACVKRMYACMWRVAKWKWRQGEFCVCRFVVIICIFNRNFNGPKLVHTELSRKRNMVLMVCMLLYSCEPICSIDIGSVTVYRKTQNKSTAIFALNMKPNRLPFRNATQLVLINSQANHQRRGN